MCDTRALVDPATVTAQPIVSRNSLTSTRAG
jgi:hypothetical protein